MQPQPGAAAHPHELAHPQLLLQQPRLQLNSQWTGSQKPQPHFVLQDRLHDEEQPQLGAAVQPQLDTVAPQLDTVAPQLGAAAPQLGAAQPQLGAAVPQLGAAAHPQLAAASQPQSEAASQLVVQQLLALQLRFMKHRIERQQLLPAGAQPQLGPVSQPTVSQP